MFKYHTYCRACGFAKDTRAIGIKSTPLTDKLVKVLSLGVQPLANSFRDETEEQDGFAPLEVLLCPKCYLAQLSVVVDPAVMYSHYSYFTSHSKMMLDHFEAIRNDIVSQTSLRSSVLEIGSNDGTFLGFLKNNPFEQVLGCDPAENLAKIANANGIPTFCGMFSEKDCDCQLKKDVVIARHVFCHVDDWHDMVRGLERVTHKESLVCIEVPYYKDMISKHSFDQVYHEHLSYLSISSVRALLKDSAFHIHKVVHYPIHGGAIMLYIRRNESEVVADPEVFNWIDNEKNALDDWRGLATYKNKLVADLRATVNNLNEQGKRVVGYGASAKSTVWVNACGFTRKDIKWICDSTTSKLFKMSPGTDIPIVSEGSMVVDFPTHAICFAWNFFSPDIYEKEKIFRSDGGLWIVPVPEVRIV